VHFSININLPASQPVQKADITAICEPVFKKIWKPLRPTTLLASMICYKNIFTFLLNNNNNNNINRNIDEKNRMLED
jgi:hypothetical protein